MHCRLLSFTHSASVPVTKFWLFLVVYVLLKSIELRHVSYFLRKPFCVSYFPREGHGHNLACISPWLGSFNIWLLGTRHSLRSVCVCVWGGGWLKDKFPAQYAGQTCVHIALHTDFRCSVGKILSRNTEHPDSRNHGTVKAQTPMSSGWFELFFGGGGWKWGIYY